MPDYGSLSIFNTITPQIFGLIHFIEDKGDLSYKHTSLLSQ
ncbi:hypothetical protein MARINOS108_20847 [Marinoscillum sp. 108]|nr:hypothetical protein MARINOS108_20847 [Marinoscillum sp. 108]